MQAIRGQVAELVVGPVCHDVVDLVGIGLTLWKAFREQVAVIVVEFADRLVCREQLGQVAVATVIELPAALEPFELDLFQVL